MYYPIDAHAAVPADESGESGGSRGLPTTAVRLCTQQTRTHMGCGDDR